MYFAKKMMLVVLAFVMFTFVACEKSGEKGGKKTFYPGKKEQQSKELKLNEGIPQLDESLMTDKPFHLTDEPKDISKDIILKDVANKNINEELGQKFKNTIARRGHEVGDNIEIKLQISNLCNKMENLCKILEERDKSFDRNSRESMNFVIEKRYIQN